MASSSSPLAALLLSLIAFSLSPLAAAYTPFPTTNTSIAAAPLSTSASPAPEQMLFAATAPAVDEQEKDSRYLAAHMSAAANKVEVFIVNEVEEKLRDPATADADKECLEVCREVFESAVESMKSGVASVGAGDFVKANFDVSAFNTDIDTCKECGAPGFEKFDRWARAVAGDCLDKIVKHTIHV